VATWRDMNRRYNRFCNKCRGEAAETLPGLAAHFSVTCGYIQPRARLENCAGELRQSIVATLVGMINQRNSGSFTPSGKKEPSRHYEIAPYQMTTES
jgi:hypothetical protein